MELSYCDRQEEAILGMSVLSTTEGTKNGPSDLLIAVADGLAEIERG
jgi:hypothetical protein